MTWDEFKEKVDNEGLGYSILHYFSQSAVEDVEGLPDGFAEEWERASVALGRIESWLYASVDTTGGESDG